MDVEVVMPTLNSARLIPEVVKRVKDHLGPKRIIVVDGGSRDDTQAIARGLGCEVLVDTRSLGSSRMTGVKACTSEIVCFIDDDIYVGEGFREKMFGIEQKNSGAILSANDKIGRGGPLAGEIRKELGDCNRERA